jgi:hypothetical protein
MGAMLALFTPGALMAQTASAPSAAASSDTVKLNPFEVIEEQDGTFQSNNVGTGSRLALDLKDAPLAYSILNREFIDALGITDLREAASWATGNTFYYTDNGSDSRGLAGQYQSRGNVTGNVTANGVADNYGTQRNFFQNATISGDSYAVESYDFGRGPNAALFGQGAGTGGGDAGNGGLAGIQSTQSKRARFDRSTTALGMELGSYNYRRFTLDYNKPINERLGVRLNAVDFDRDGWRRFERQTTRGLTFTSTYKIGTSGDLRLEMSNEKRQQHTVGVGWDEFLSGWDGQTVFRGPMLNSIQSTNATVGATSVANASYGTIQVFGGGLTFNGEPQGVTRQGANQYYYNVGDGTIMNWQNFAFTRRADSTSNVPVWSKNAPNGAFYQRSSLPLQGNGQLQPSFGVSRSFLVYDHLPADMFNKAMQNSRFRIPSQRFTNTADIPLVEQISRDVQLNYSQRVGNSLYFELGADANRNTNTNRNLDDPNPGGRSAYLDLNQIRPDGSPNPNFLDTFSTVPMVQSLNTTSDRTLRANAAYVLDAGKWGNYNFNAQASASQRKVIQRAYTMSMMVNADPRAWNADAVRSFNYWGDPVHAWKEPINGTTVQFTNVTWDTANNNPVVQPTVTRQPAWVLNTWSNSFVQSRYVTLQSTAKYWRDKLVFTAALRRDLQFGNTKSSLNRSDLPATWDNSTPYFRPDAPADYWSMTYIQKNNSTGVAINTKPILATTRPRTTVAGISVPISFYSGDRFRDDYNGPKYREYSNNRSYGGVYHITKEFSFLLNYADSYSPQTSQSLDLNGEVRKPTQSHSRDVGFTWSLFNGKVTGKYNYFVQTRENDSLTPGTSAPINQLYQANAFADSDQTASGRNTRNAVDLPGADYVNRRNFGYEIDLAINVNRALRFTANGSSAWYAQNNRAPLTMGYIPANTDLFKQILEDAGGRLDTSVKPVGVAVAPGTAFVNTALGTAAFPADQQQAVNAYNNIWVQYQSLVNQRNLRLPLPPSMNLATDYTIQGGKARGLRIGVGVQWQKAVISNQGSDTILDPNNPVPTAIPYPNRNGDATKIVWGASNFHTQMNLAYAYKLQSGNSVNFALRIDNPLNDRKVIFGDNGVFGGAGFPAGGGRQPQGDLSKPNRERFAEVLSDIHAPISGRLSVTYTFGSGGSRR